MALIAGYGGTLTFSGTTSVACRSFTLNWERASLDITQIGDFRERRAAGRIRRFGTVTLYRQDGTIDDTLVTSVTRRAKEAVKIPAQRGGNPVSRREQCPVSACRGGHGRRLQGAHVQ